MGLPLREYGGGCNGCIAAPRRGKASLPRPAMATDRVAQFICQTAKLSAPANVTQAR